MGQTLLALAEEEGMEVAARADEGEAPGNGLERARVAIDFSFHNATPELAAACASKGLPLVIGTTGHSAEEREKVLSFTESIPIVWAGNYSIGVNLLAYLVSITGSVLGDRYHPEIMEIHHSHKKDAPSGTALDLVKAIKESPAFASAALVHGRSGETGERPSPEIGVHALRGGEVVGEHTSFFFGPYDRLELTHRAADRRIFASGAYRAARWALEQPPGLYSMRDVLGLTAAGGPAT
jgi:4-hydroxy-tetrahydrodipicolinate reductase